MTISTLKKLSAAVVRSRHGATAIEYGLIAALIAGVISVGVGTLGDQLDTTFTDVKTDLAGTAPAG